jgi:hypothetical protein
MARIEQRNFDDCGNQEGAQLTGHGTVVDEPQSGIVDVKPIVGPMMIRQAGHPFAAMSITRRGAADYGVGT